ncbi:hypothetical protein [Clostridium psychrophilum]|uniref:hypothetical protein n=1 Tax=Clostridium psychrophilum TaxID=132926 RepID=UPI001C0C5BB2|nr:hypothetical protein [Clostridium psychrophilum]MBU3179921.1 hypothetical protein [Clostridium psychrophilum]
MTSKVENMIWLVWKNDEGKSFKIGELSKETEKYYFEYDTEGVKKAEAYGFTPLPYFPKVDAKYFREGLFRSFLKRLPMHGKREITSVLKEYEIEKYDDLELLKKSGGKMPTDSFEFTAPFSVDGIDLAKEDNTVDEEKNRLAEKDDVLAKKDETIYDKSNDLDDK